MLVITYTGNMPPSDRCTPPNIPCRLPMLADTSTCRDRWGRSSTPMQVDRGVASDDPASPANQASLTAHGA